ISDFLNFFERETGRIQLDALRPSSMIFSEGFQQALLKRTAKRLFDIVASLLLLALTWPFMCAATLAIWIESGGRGPILYRQTRVGFKDRLFEVIKFRSMRVDAEKDGVPRWAGKGDSRVTRVGAVLRETRVDELPQLFNVLRGDMSFVGPRPERPQFVAELNRKIPYYSMRHMVNPGITGWAQICYPYGASEQDAREKLQYDLFYIKNYSFFFDVVILLQTVHTILWGAGAR
ncbi:MAG: TIGR03013 family XrtA/PEP-CTERM system glycosyltransferase, partial [Candidatus Competibacteraceae bacterium]